MLKLKNCESSSPDSYREVEHKSSSSQQIARVAQLVEHNLAKVGVAGSNPVSRSKAKKREIHAFLV